MLNRESDGSRHAPLGTKSITPRWAEIDMKASAADAIEFSDGIAAQYCHMILRLGAALLHSESAS